MQSLDKPANRGYIIVIDYQKHGENQMYQNETTINVHKASWIDLYIALGAMIAVVIGIAFI